jgi:hypothetical protein
VVAVRTEREANRYEPLNETHRRVAEEEEKRRLAEQARSVPVQREPEPQRPGTDPRPHRPEAAPDHDPDSPEAQLAAWRTELEDRVRRGEITRGEMLHSMRLFDAELRIERELSDPRIPRPQRDSTGNRQRDVSAETEHSEPQSPQRESEAEPDSPEARYAAKVKELEEKVQRGQITPAEKGYQLRRFDNELAIEIEQGGTPSPAQERDSTGNRRDKVAAEPEHDEPQSPQRAGAIRDQPAEPIRDDPSQRVPETRIEREAEAAEHEITGRGEMSDARAARLERLRGIDRDIERESHENEGEGPDLGHDSGDRSR